MVKNTTGGSKHKGQARKFANAPRQAAKLRLSEDEAEKYAQVSRLLGNGMCHVATLDGTKLLCIIRGKFRGRSKRDNIIKTGSWILVGLREWESTKSTTSTEMNKCDLLEVYSDLDKDKLKNSVNLNWKPFLDNDSIFSSENDKDELIQFTNDDQEEYRKIMEAQMMAKQPTSIALDSIADEEEEEIDIDDI